MSQIINSENFVLLPDSFLPMFLKLINREAIKVCQQFHESDWVLYPIPNTKLFFMFPQQDSTYSCHANNVYAVDLTAMAFGYVCTIFALDTLIENLIEHKKYDKIKPYQDIFDGLKNLAYENLRNQKQDLAFLSRDILGLID